MSVLIKGMEMPKDDYVVMTLYPSGDCYLYYKGCGGIAKKAEVIEVPTPHGRLIDASKCRPYFYDHLDDLHMEIAEIAIEEMPTIIEAEDGT